MISNEIVEVLANRERKDFTDTDHKIAGDLIIKIEKAKRDTKNWRMYMLHEDSFPMCLEIEVSKDARLSYCVQRYIHLKYFQQCKKIRFMPGMVYFYV